jgi:O-antigen ligase
MLVAKKGSVLNQIVLALVFTLSFIIYFAPALTVSLQLAPLVAFAALVFCKALSADSLITALAGFLEIDGLLYVVFLSVLMLVSSFESSYGEAIQFALLLSICLLLARIYMTLVPIREVLEAFYWSAIVSMLIFLPLSFSTLIQSAMTLERLKAFNFHPNGLALQLSAYICVMIWKVMTGGRFAKIFSGAIASVCIVIIFLTSSRGAIVGVLAGAGFAICIVLANAVKQDRKKTLRSVGMVLALLAAGTVVLQNVESIKEAYEVVDHLLALSTSDRGLDSGMTGRVDIWHEVLRAVSDGSWLFGHGVRSSDAVWSYDPKIDNSYLVILYDMGIVPLSLITWRFVTVLGRTTRNCFGTIDDDEKKLQLACGMFLVVLLVTSIVERSLFAVGNPFSLLAFLFFVTPTRCLEMRGRRIVRSHHSMTIQSRPAFSDHP